MSSDDASNKMSGASWSWGGGIVRRGIGVITAPGLTFRVIAQARPVGQALVVLVVVGVLNAAVSAILGLQDASYPLSLLPPEFRVGGAFLQVLVSVFLLVFAPVVAYKVVATKYFGGEGTLSAVFSTVSFANVVNLFAVPIAPLPLLFGAIGTVLTLFAYLLLAVWTALLHVLAIRECYHLTTTRAVSTFVVAFCALIGGLFLLSLLVTVIFIIIAVSIGIPGI